MTSAIPEVTKPALTWAQFCEKMPIGRAPLLKDIFDRWSSKEIIMSKAQPDAPAKKIGERNRDDGEPRAYIAWVTGLMEPEEQTYFSMMSIRTDALVATAVVPVVRELLAREQRILTALEDANRLIKQLSDRVTAVAGARL